MDAFNEFFKNLATKLHLPSFFKSTTLILNNFFLILLLAVLVIALVLVIVLVPSKKKGKKAKDGQESEETSGEEKIEEVTDSDENAAEETESEDMAKEEIREETEAPVEQAEAPETVKEEEQAESEPEILAAVEAEEEKEEIAEEPQQEEEKEEPAQEEAKEEPQQEEEKEEPAQEEAKEEPAVQEELAAAKEEKPVKEAKAKKASSKKEAAESKTVGKYEIVERSGSFYFLLKANNGQLLLESPSYTTEQGAKKAIETFKNAVEGGEFTIDEDKNGNFRFILKASARSQMRYYGESYSTRQSAENSIGSVKKFAANAIVKVTDATDEEAAQANDSATVFVPDPITADSYKAGGKYEIIERGGNYYFILKANNGQLLLESPSFTSEQGAKSGIESFKKAAEVGIYTIDEDKNGNFKFILRASARSQMRYFGEAYSTRQSAENSVNSVRSFAAKAVLKKADKAEK